MSNFGFVITLRNGISAQAMKTYEFFLPFLPNPQCKHHELQLQFRANGIKKKKKQKNYEKLSTQTD